MLLPDKPAVTDTDLYRTAAHYEHIAASLQPEVATVLPEVAPETAQTYLQMCVDGFQYARTQLQPNRLKLLWTPRQEPTIKQTEFLAANMLTMQKQPDLEPTRYKSAVKAGRYLMATTVGVITPDGQKIAQMAQTYRQLRTPQA